MHKKKKWSKNNLAGKLQFILYSILLDIICPFAISIYKHTPISCVWTNICGRTELFKNRLFNRKKKKTGNFKN